MVEDDLLIALEDASAAIGRLDARLKGHPLREAWHVRSACKAAISLAAVDGIPVREADLVGFMMGARLPVSESYLGAAEALKWWQKAMGRIVLSESSKRLLGVTIGRRQSAREAQDDFDREDHLSTGARRVLAKTGEAAPVDDWVDAGALRALEAMRREGRGLVAIAAGLKSALSSPRDPDWSARSWDLQRRLKEQAEQRLEAETIGWSDEDVAERRRQVEEMLGSLIWEGPKALGEAHLAVADRILETGLTSSRLTILTGATKRIAIERRGDHRAIIGFLHILTREAREGEALLSALEEMVMKWVKAPSLSFDPRSSLPDILWAILVLPAVDVGWLSTALELSPRVTQKFMHRIASEGMISHWAERRAERVERRDADIRLWVPDGFEEALERNVRHARIRRRAEHLDNRSFAEVASQLRDMKKASPMAEVFQRFEQQIIDIEKEFGRFWEPNRA